MLRRQKHPHEVALLRHHDGELHGREGARVGEHVATCCDCRRHVAKLAEVMETFAEHREHAAQYAPPPLPWGDLRTQFASIDRDRAHERRFEWLGRRPALMLVLAAGLGATTLVYRVIQSPLSPPQPRPVTQSLRVPPPSPKRPAEAPSRHDTNVVLPPPTAGDELRVIATLHRIGADLGDPIDVVRGSTNIAVTVAGLSEEKWNRLRSALAGVPRASFRFSAQDTPKPRQRTSLMARDVVGAANAAAPTELARHFSTPGELETFVDRLLNDSDTLMARVYALHHLAERFSPATEAVLASDEMQTLTQLRMDHEHAIQAQVRAIRDSLHSILPAVPATRQEVAGQWQARAERVFSEASEFDRLVGAVFAGVRDAPPEERNPVRLAAALASLEADVSSEQ